MAGEMVYLTATIAGEIELTKRMPLPGAFLQLPGPGPDDQHVRGRAQ
jgi:hypothetical protein